MSETATRDTERAHYVGPRVDLIGRTEAAKLLGLSPSMVSILVANGTLVVYPWVDSYQHLLTLESVQAYQHARKAAEAAEGV